MRDTTTNCAQATDRLSCFCDLAATDLRIIAHLHDRELDRDTVTALRADHFPSNLALHLELELGTAALALLEGAVAKLDADDGRQIDELAADYASVYLNNGCHASPYESVWLDEDGLTMQQPMFQVRAFYARHGLAVQDWRKRSEDHLVHELQFIAELLTRADPESVAEATRFLDDHALRWIPDFAGRVTVHAATDFYAGLALLTGTYLEELREILARVLDRPRPCPQSVGRRASPRAKAELPAAPSYVPGIAPSW